MSSRMEKLRAAWAKSDSNESRPNNYFPFFLMKNDETAVVRFLPDVNESNPLDFVVEKLMHTLTVNGEDKTIPCLKMYDKSAECPICKVSAAFYKKEGKGSVNGKKYWRKKQHIAQALVLEDPLPADKDSGENHEGKVRFLNIGWQLHGKIDSEFKSGELDEVPYDYDEGCNFVIAKSEQGEYSTYSLASRFARKTSGLTDEQKAIVEEGMVDLSTLLPPKPDLSFIESQLEASLTGASVDDAGNADSSNSAPAPTTKASAPAMAKEDAPAPAAATVEEDSDEADDVLAAIQQRRKARAAS